MKKTSLVTNLMMCMCLLAVSVPVPKTAAQSLTKYEREQLDRPFYDENSEEAPACSSTGTGGTSNTSAVDTNFSLGTDPTERRVNLVKALMTDFQLSAEQASGVVGNFMRESGGPELPPNVNEYLNIDGGSLRTGETPMPGNGPGPPRPRREGINTGGYGWAQWTAGRKDSFVSFMLSNQYISSTSESATDAANYAYLKHELTTGYAVTITELKTQTSPAGAATSFEETYEGAAVPALDDRIQFAEQAFNEFKSSDGTTNAGSGNCGGPGGDGAAILGEFAFPLLTTKSGILNNSIFRNGTTGLSDHDYTAYDISVATGTRVVAFMGGRVSRIGLDRCPGRYVSVYNEQNDITISYLHLSLSNHAAVGTVVEPGDHIGIVGTLQQGCTEAHLHIDGIRGPTRLACSRLSCPPATAALFQDLGAPLFQTYELLAD